MVRPRTSKDPNGSDIRSKRPKLRRLKPKAPAESSATARRLTGFLLKAFILVSFSGTRAGMPTLSQLIARLHFFLRRPDPGGLGPTRGGNYGIRRLPLPRMSKTLPGFERLPRFPRPPVPGMMQGI
jgi:hypothetical protein